MSNTHNNHSRYFEKKLWTASLQMFMIDVNTLLSRYIYIYMSYCKRRTYVNTYFRLIHCCSRNC